MNDPRTYFAAQTAAYALPNPSPGLIDVLIGQDLNGLSPYAAVLQNPDGSQTVAFKGTTDEPEWIEDAEITPVKTALGTVTEGIWLTYTGLQTQSGVPLSRYGGASVCGHSRGGPLAALWAIQYNSPDYCLFACPRLLGSDALATLHNRVGMAWQMKGDLVPLVFIAYPELPAVTEFPAPSSIFPLDVKGHHVFASYQLGITAFLS